MADRNYKQITLAEALGKYIKGEDPSILLPGDGWMDYSPSTLGALLSGILCFAEDAGAGVEPEEEAEEEKDAEEGLSTASPADEEATEAGAAADDTAEESDEAEEDDTASDDTVKEEDAAKENADSKTGKSDDSEEAKVAAAVMELDGKEKGRKKIDDGKIMALKKAGWSNSKIADEMGVSVATIGYHLKRMIE